MLHRLAVRRTRMRACGDSTQGCYMAGALPPSSSGLEILAGRTSALGRRSRSGIGAGSHGPVASLAVIIL